MFPFFEKTKMADETYFGNNSMIFMKFTTVMHNDPLNHTGRNEMLFAGQTRLGGTQRTISCTCTLVPPDEYD